MPNLNVKIEEKLSSYPKSVQDIAKKAIEAGHRLDPARLAQFLESQVKILARREVKK